MRTVTWIKLHPPHSAASPTACRRDPKWSSVSAKYPCCRAASQLLRPLATPLPAPLHITPSSGAPDAVPRTACASGGPQMEGPPLAAADASVCSATCATGKYVTEGWCRVGRLPAEGGLHDIDAEPPGPLTHDAARRSPILAPSCDCAEPSGPPVV